MRRVALGLIVTALLGAGCSRRQVTLRLILPSDPNPETFAMSLSSIDAWVWDRNQCGCKEVHDNAPGCQLKDALQAVTFSKSSSTRQLDNVPQTAAVQIVVHDAMLIADCKCLAPPPEDFLPFSVGTPNPAFYDGGPACRSGDAGVAMSSDMAFPIADMAVLGDH